MSNKKLYKFLNEGLKSEHGNCVWTIGEWKTEKNISICNRGFHASKTPLQALGYVGGSIVAQVEVKGENITDSDKECWESMRIIKAWHWTKEDSVELAIFSAELVIDIFEKYDKNDDRPRKAIEAAKNCLEAVKSGNKDTTAAEAAYVAENAADDAAYVADAVDEAVYAASAAARAAEAAYTAYAASAAEYTADESVHTADAASAAARAAYAATYAAYVAYVAHAADAAARTTYVAALKKLTRKIDSWFLKKIKTLKPYEA